MGEEVCTDGSVYFAVTAFSIPLVPRLPVQVQLAQSDPMGVSSSFWPAWGKETHLTLWPPNTLGPVEGTGCVFIFIEEVVLYAWDIQIALFYLGSEEGAFSDSALIGIRGNRRTFQVDG